MNGSRSAPEAASVAAPAQPRRPRRLRAHLATPLYHNAYFLIIGAITSGLLGFLFWTLAARHYAADIVGLNSAVVSAMMLVSGACQLGLNSVLVRYLPAAGLSTRRLVLASYLLAGALSVGGALVVALTSSRWSPRLAFLGDDPRWLVAFVGATTIWSIFVLQDSVMVGIRQARWVAMENSSFAAAKIALLIAIVSAAPTSGIFLAWTVPVAISLLPVNLLIFLRLIPRHVKGAGRASLDPWRMVRLASGNYVGSLFMLASTLLLPILVTNESGTRDTAYFFVPWMIATTLQLVAVNMTASLTVEAAFDELRLREYCRRVIVQTARLVLAPTLLLLVAAPYVLQAFGSAYASEGTTLLRLLAISTVPNVVVVLGLSIARIQHSGRRALTIQALQCLVTIGLSFLLLPPLGIEGVGIAWLASQLVVALWVALGIVRPVLLGRWADDSPGNRGEGSKG